ncbi:MAG TPA: hypothetical protein VGN63_03300 [Flavisolibacter sp.]|jgi:hypothetical protein|nr:hypothetical protein [Flavisolibacter sp.]
MYLTMLLAGQVIDQQYISPDSLKVPGRLQGAIHELEEDFEEEIKSSGESPRFVLLEWPKQPFLGN